VSQARKIVFHVGGPSFHPVDQQARLVEQWLGSEYSCTRYDGVPAFEHLSDCDLLVLMGLHWTGLSSSDEVSYSPMEPVHRRAFESYVGSGRPLLVHHGAIASYDDWPHFGELAGFTWIWGESAHSPIGDYRIEIVGTEHPITKHLKAYEIHDELYYGIRISPELNPEVHATTSWNHQELPMILTASGGRIEGAGKTAYLANGHGLEAFASPALRQIWVNAVEWLLDEAE